MTKPRRSQETIVASSASRLPKWRVIRRRAQGVGVVGVHVLDDSGGAVEQRIGLGREVVVSRHPSHHAEAADEVDVGDVEAEEREVGEVDPVAADGWRSRYVSRIDCKGSSMRVTEPRVRR
jgi:hypothetical protein